MITKPVLTNLSSKATEYSLIILVTLMYIAVCAEVDIYVPAFPQMVKYFEVAENQIQLTLSLNFAGLSISGLVVGPLSDCYGRRKVLLAGLLLFVLSSLGCMLCNSFKIMLFWRLLQGISASVPMVIGTASLFDKYSTEKAGQIIGIVNSMISASMAGAPIVGAWISKMYNWRFNFTVIFALALTIFIGTLLFIEETLTLEKRKKFSLTNIAKDYIKLSKSLKFINYTLIVSFPLTAIVVYVANLSLILINHMHMDLVEFSYYQSTTMGSFIIFSIASVKLIAKRGVDYTKNLGGIIAIIGSVGIFIISEINHQKVNIICISMAFIAAGGALMAGTFGMKAMLVHPHMKGTSLAYMTFIRQILAAGLVALSEIYFDGTIRPIATIIFAYGIISVILYLMVDHRLNFEW